VIKLYAATTLKANAPTAGYASSMMRVRPIWTPDGDRITVMSDRDGFSSIYSQDAEGRGPAEKLTTAETGTLHLPDLGRRGTLSFAVVRGGFGQSWGLYTRSPDGQTTLFYDLPMSNQCGLAFSPDGQWLGCVQRRIDQCE
jgi:hypothetical protein